MRHDPYAHCPRLPEEGEIDPRSVFLEQAPDAQSAFRSTDPVELEIGPGRGWFTIERLQYAPSVRVLGVEVRRKWATIVDERLKKRGLGTRGRVFADDIRLVLPRFVAQSLSVAYVHFPDPWWKKRHNKRLVVSQELLVELSRVLLPGGELLVQTDVFERADEYERIVGESGLFLPIEHTARVLDHPYGARSPRERKAMENGLPVARLRYKNVGAQP